VAVRASFQPLEAFRPGQAGYQLLPFRFTRIPGVDRVLLTSEAGEFEFVDEATVRALAAGTLDRGSDGYADLQAKQFLAEGDAATAIRLLAAKLRTRKSFLRGGPPLHVFVVTLRCDHSCLYCQVSRRPTGDAGADMSVETALAAVERMFEAPAPALTVEFQGGEPLLAFPLIRRIVEAIEARLRC